MNNSSIIHLSVVERCSRASPFVPPSKIGITKPQLSPSPRRRRTSLFLLALPAHLNKGDIPDEIEITRKGKEHDHPPLEFYWVIILLPWIFPDVLQLSNITTINNRYERFRTFSSSLISIHREICFCVKYTC